MARDLDTAIRLWHRRVSAGWTEEELTFLDAWADVLAALEERTGLTPSTILTRSDEYLWPLVNVQVDTSVPREEVAGRLALMRKQRIEHFWGKG